jgi:hypothetical protein
MQIMKIIANVKASKKDKYPKKFMNVAKTKDNNRDKYFKNFIKFICVPFLYC